MTVGQIGRNGIALSHLLQGVLEKILVKRIGTVYTDQK